MLDAHLTLVARAKAREWRYLGARSYAECLGVITSSLYRKWGAAIANANAQLRMTRLEAAGARGPGARAYGVRDGVCAGLGEIDSLDDMFADVGGGHGPGLL